MLRRLSAIAFLLFFSFLWAQEPPAAQDTLTAQPITYAVVIMSSEPLSRFFNRLEAPIILDTLLDMPAEELMLIDTTGNTSVVSTERVLSAMAKVVGEDEVCADRLCVSQVAKQLEMDKIILVDLSQLKVKTGLDAQAFFSGRLLLSVTFLGVGTNIDTGEEVELLLTESTFPKKLKGNWDELAIRIRSRTWRLLSATPPEGRFPPEPVTFELSQLLLFFEDSPVAVTIVGGGILSGLVVGYMLATRPPVIGNPPPYPETL